MLLTGFFLSLGIAVAQNEVKGDVVSSDRGVPVIGATIRVVVNNNTGTATYYNSDFTLTIPKNG